MKLSFVLAFSLCLTYTQAFAQADEDLVNQEQEPVVEVEAPRVPCKTFEVIFCIQNESGAYEWTDAVDFNPATCERTLPKHLIEADPKLCLQFAQAF